MEQYLKNTMTCRGPSSLNLHPTRYLQQDQQNGPDQSEQSIQKKFFQFAEDIRKCDEVLAKVAQSLDEASMEEYFITDFYPTFALNCTYELDQEKKIISDTGIELGKIMDNLERSNKNLKEEIKGWLFQYAKKTRLSQILLSENKLLRKYVSTKNKDIVKLIQSITNAENQQLNSLNQDLNELKQENGVLMDHLKQIKQNLKDKQDEQRKIVDAYQRAQKQKLDIKAKIQAGEDHEEHYSKMVSLLQASIEDTTKRQKKLLEQKQRLTRIKRQYEDDQEQIRKQIEACKIDSEQIDRHLKVKFKGHQTQKQTLMEEIEQLTEKVQKTKQQNEKHQEEIARYEHRIEQFQNICNDLVKRSAEMQEALTKSEQEMNKLKQIQVQHLSAIDMINFDIDVLKEELKELEQQEEANKQRYKKQLKELENQNKEELAKWNETYTKTQSKVSRAILQEKAGLAIKKKEIQQWEFKINEKKSEIEDLKQQMIEIKENQVQLANLRQKLREAEKK